MEKLTLVTLFALLLNVANAGSFTKLKEINDGTLIKLQDDGVECILFVPQKGRAMSNSTGGIDCDGKLKEVDELTEDTLFDLDNVDLDGAVQRTLIGKSKVCYIFMASAPGSWMTAKERGGISCIKI